uniref:DHH family phosphoesterase n=1 Tax=Flavobacterium sp. TaxID=239 RepID=UPI0040496A61
MNILNIEIAQSLLATPKKIVIVPHRNPDGDAMGSTLGLCLFLKKIGHQAIVMAPNEFPDFLAWMPESEQIKIFEKDITNCKNILAQADFIFTLDFNALHRTGEVMESYLSKLTCPFLMIDHHQAPENYPIFMYSDTQMSSTCEMVYHFIKGLKQESLIDKNIATCLYTGIVTDTGSFKFSATKSSTHEAVASLIALGIENAKIHNQLFDTQSYNRLQLLGKALQNMKILPEYRTAYITLSQDELDAFQYKKGDTEGFVNYGLSIKGVIFAAIFIENKEEGIVKISFRSQDAFDVNQFARKHFQGGGHINAAGGKSVVNLIETASLFENIIKNYPELKQNENHE